MAENQPIPKLLTIKEVAARLALSGNAVRDLCVAGVLPYRRVGVTASRGGNGRIRIEEADLAAYLESAKVAPPETIPFESGSPKKRISRRAVSTESFAGGCKLLRAAGWKG